MGSPAPRPIAPVQAVLVSYHPLTGTAYDVRAVRRTLPEAVAWLAGQRFAYLGSWLVEVWTEKGCRERYGWSPSDKTLVPMFKESCDDSA